MQVHVHVHVCMYVPPLATDVISMWFGSDCSLVPRTEGAWE